MTGLATIGRPTGRHRHDRHAPGRRVLALAVAWIVFGTLTPALPAASAQDESGKAIEFPFRNPSGEIVWFARADRGEHRFGVRHPLRGNIVTHAHVFERSPTRASVTRNTSPGRPGEREEAGVRVVLPVRTPGGNAAGSETSRVIVLESDQARFFPEYDLLEFNGVRMELRYSDRSVRRDSDAVGSGDSADPAAAGEPGARGQRRGNGPEVLTDRLYIQWETVPGFKEKVATIFTEERFTLNAPEQDIVIRQGTGLLTREAERFATVQIQRDVDGTFMRLPLAIGSADTTPAWEGTRFACDGSCTIVFDGSMSGQAREIRMRRGVVLSQGVGRELHCRELDVTLVPGKTAEDPPRISRLLARDQVDLSVPGNFRARVGLLVMSWDEDAVGSRFIAVMRHVVRLQLWASDNVQTGTGGLTPSMSGGRTAVRARVDATARDRIVLRSHRLNVPRRGEPAGAETWEFVGQARMERWIRRADAETTPEGDVADFGVRLSRDVVDSDVLRPRPDQSPVPRATSDGWTLSAVLNGAGNENETGGSTEPGATSNDVDDPATLLRAPPIILQQPVPIGAIVLQFTLSEIDRSPTRTVRQSEPVRTLEALFAHNPGNVPVLELHVDDVRSSLRFFAGRFEVRRVPGSADVPGGQTGDVELTRFSGGTPLVIWLTQRDFNPLAELDASDQSLQPDPDSPTMFRYSARSTGPITMRQRFPADGRRTIERLDLELSGRARLQKTLWTGGRGIDADRHHLLCDCGDLNLGFTSAFNGNLELVSIDAKPLPAPDAGQPATGPAGVTGVDLHIGPDHCNTLGLLYRCEPTGADPRPGRLDGRELPSPWSEMLRLEGPVELQLRDPATCRLIPVAGRNGDANVAAFVRLVCAQRVVLRTALLRTLADPTAIERRTLELIGPCELQAFADDPLLLRSDQTPRRLMLVRGDYLHAKMVTDHLPGDDGTPIPFERVEQLALAGNASLDYTLQGLQCGAQRVDYRHDPLDSADPLPHLELSGSPSVRYTLTGGSRNGVGEVVFPETRNPVELASRRIELIGEPDRIVVRPRCGLRWTPTNGEAMLMMADRMDIGLAHAPPPPRPGQVEPPVVPFDDSIAARARRSRRGLLADGGGSLAFRELTAAGNVTITQGDREARGDEFHWTDDLRGRRVGELRGRDPRFVSNEPGQVNIDLFHLDTARSATMGSVWRFIESDPDHPERRNIITADGHDRQRLRLRVPR
ncbi:MAG: hypothetical protein AB7K09_09105 [Planctomycetota bacterium]